MDITQGTATDDHDELSRDDGASDEFVLAEGGVAPGTGFSDRKAPGAFRTIGEVAKALGIRQHVLRYWEEQFPMLSPVKRSGNRRYYRPEDVLLIERIDRLVHHEGYTLRGARLALEPASRKGKRTPVSATGEIAPATGGTADGSSAMTPLLEELRAIRATLTAALAA